MKTSDGGAAAVPAELLAAGTRIRAVGTELGDLPRSLTGVPYGAGCTGPVPGALAGLVRASTGALGRLGEQVQGLALSVEAAAGDFQRADGQ